MNYFKGNGSCGVTTSPNYINVKNSVIKYTIKPNTSGSDFSIKNLAKKPHYSSMIFTD